jgi:hypothetical protein
MFQILSAYVRECEGDKRDLCVSGVDDFPLRKNDGKIIDQQLHNT